MIGIRVIFTNSEGNWIIKKNSIMFNKGIESKPYVPYKSDKKQLLYYNEETQTWEKPVLREWDSIEKHSDGKYYYHQRSEEVDYISGDENLTDCITDMNKTVKKISTEKIYECTNIDLITYQNETNYIVESGAITPKTTLKVHNNISNIVNLLQKKVSILENNMTDYIITQNRLTLTSRYSTDNVGFNVNAATLSVDDSLPQYDNDLYNLILDNIIVGKDNYDKNYMESLINFYWMTFIISDEMFFTLSNIIEEQYNTEELEESPINN